MCDPLSGEFCRKQISTGADLDAQKKPAALICAADLMHLRKFSFR
jgi:hypothetical protein